MDTRTGEIVDWEVMEKIKKDQPSIAKIYKEIPDLLLAEMEGMNRKQRRDYYRKNKKRFKTEVK